MIEVITMAYNDEKLLPFLLGHYSFADAVHVIIDSATTDRSAEICARYPNVDVRYFTFPDGFDDTIKAAKINETAMECRDWIINVDTDEFAFCDVHTPLYHYLSEVDVGVVNVNFWTVYRNRVEKDLDISLPALLQRRHGDHNQGVCYGFSLFNKPIIAKRSLNPRWAIGNHLLHTDPPYTNHTTINGAHWAMADADIAILRRIGGQQKRQSQSNRANGMCVQHYSVTEEEIRAECESHLDDPRLF